MLKTACFTILFVPIFGKPRVLRCFPAPGRQIACFSRVLRRPLPKTTRFTMFSRPWALKVARGTVYPGAHVKKSTRFTMLSEPRVQKQRVLRCFPAPHAENHAFYDVFRGLGAENHAFYDVLAWLWARPVNHAFYDVFRRANEKSSSFLV